MHVGGLDSTTGEHVEWPAVEIGVGDQILTRIIETEGVDEPSSRSSRAEVAALMQAEEGDVNGPGSSALQAGLFLHDPQTGDWLGHGRKNFRIFPRIGEWVEVERDGIAMMAKVVMVAHHGETGSTGGIALYTSVEGETSDCLKRLGGSS